MEPHNKTAFLLSHAVLLFSLFFTVNAFAESDNPLKSIDQSIRLRQYQQAVENLQPLIRQNNTEAQYRMAGLYRAGKGVKQNTDKALELYRKAAIGGLAKAQYALASLLEKQGSAEQIKREVNRWYQAAAQQGYRKAQRKLQRLKLSPEKSQVVSPNKIFSAIRNNDSEQIDQWVRQSVNFNIVDNKQRTPLMVALISGHPKLAEHLFDLSKRVDLPDINQDRPLHIASNRGYRTIVRKLIVKKVDLNAQDKLGNTALILATRHDDSAIIELLLKNKADVTIKNRKQQTAPSIAQTLNLKSAKKLFQKYRIKLPEQDKEYTQLDLQAFRKNFQHSDSIYKGWPLLNIASVLGETAIARQLLQQGSKINATDPEGNTALHRAASKGQLQVVQLLLKQGISINAVNHQKESALYVAAREGQLKVLKTLLKNGANSNLLTHQGKTALSAAIINQHPACASILARYKLNKVAIHQALQLAIANKMEKVAILLARRDNRLLFSDEKNRSVLWKSVEKGLYQLTKILIESKKIPLDQADNKGYTALARAAYNGDEKMFQLLVSAGADIHSVTQQKNNILMLAILAENASLIRRIIAMDIDINARNNAGDSALILAAARGNLDAVKRLIEAKADIQIRNNHDRNAYQVALDAGHQKTADYIKAKSGKLFQLFN